MAEIDLDSKMSGWDQWLCVLSVVVMLIGVSWAGDWMPTALIMLVGGVASFPPFWTRLLPRLAVPSLALFGVLAGSYLVGQAVVPSEVRDSIGARKLATAQARASARIAETEAERAKADAEAADKANTAQIAADREAEEIASGEHCLRSWDGSFPRLKAAVKRGLRNPGSFEHIDTVRSSVDAKGTFALIMTYRAENGFGGMNIEPVAVEVDAKSCDFEEASTASLAKRIRANGG